MAMASSGKGDDWFKKVTRARSDRVFTAADDNNSKWRPVPTSLYDGAGLQGPTSRDPLALSMRVGMYLMHNQVRVMLPDIRGVLFDAGCEQDYPGNGYRIYPHTQDNEFAMQIDSISRYGFPTGDGSANQPVVFLPDDAKLPDDTTKLIPESDGRPYLIRSLFELSGRAVPDQIQMPLDSLTVTNLKAVFGNMEEVTLHLANNKVLNGCETRLLPSGLGQYYVFYINEGHNGLGIYPTSGTRDRPVVVVGSASLAEIQRLEEDEHVKNIGLDGITVDVSRALAIDMSVPQVRVPLASLTVTNLKAEFGSMEEVTLHLANNKVLKGCETRHRPSGQYYIFYIDEDHNGLGVYPTSGTRARPVVVVGAASLAEIQRLEYYEHVKNIGLDGITVDVSPPRVRAIDKSVPHHPPITFVDHTSRAVVV
jgi:hypothetical protein